MIEDMIGESVLLIGFVIYLCLLTKWFLKSMYKSARNELMKAREEFKQVTGHYPPKSKRDNWFQWEKK